MKKVAYITRIKEYDNTKSIDENFLRCRQNTGNYLFDDAIKNIFKCSIINYDEFNINLSNEFDAFITSDLIWIQENNDKPHVHKVFEMIPKDKPLIPISIGLQASDYISDFKFNSELLKLLQEMSERCILGCRGNYTAETLYKNGVKNVKVIGCPSMYYNINSDFIIINPKVLPNKPRISMNATLYPNDLVTSKVLREFVEYMIKNDVIYIEQTNFNWVDLISEGDIQLSNKISEWLKTNKKIYFDYNSWLNYIRNFDFVLGGRFHGNVVALQAGVPAYFMVQDSRTREMCEYFNLPFMYLKNFNAEVKLQDMYERADYSYFNKQFPKKFADFLEFINKNDINPGIDLINNKKIKNEVLTIDSFYLKTKEPLLSVIVPVYNTEAFLPKCIDSILSQTYKNIEVIIVNDKSTGNAKEIIQEYINKDNRIKYVEHEKNEGLFKARLTGSELATGEYIAFVDSDDYIEIDYFRIMMKKAIETNADIVASKVIMEDENKYTYVYNISDLVSKELNGEAILNEYFKQEGRNFYWHTIWNKIYSKEIWNKSCKYYKKLDKHLIMTEDFVFSTVLFYFAQKFTWIDYHGYYYYKHSQASTSIKGDINKFKKNIEDLKTSFEFVESFLIEVNIFEKYKYYFLNWRKRYSRYWFNSICWSELSDEEKRQISLELKNALKQNELNYCNEEDAYFNSVSTPWDNRYNNIKEKIRNNKYKYISFDIFDTLILRPFYEPQDLFILLEDYFNNICPKYNNLIFSKIRQEAEDELRKIYSIEKPSFQDVNIYEIYDYISKKYNLSKELTNKILQKEIELEINFCTKRNSGKELYDFAISLGKEIICISDMYLPKDIIKRILETNGYINIKDIYVSSEIRLLKNTGALYKYVIKKLNIEPSKILHIGDNWESDKIMSEKQGLDSCFFPKTKDVFFNWLSDKNTGEHSGLFFEPKGLWQDYRYAKTYFGIRCMLAVVANKIFDYPYIPFNSQSDFNADAYFIGYYALGMHSFGVAKWLIDNAKKEGYNKIHFLARDSYLIKEIFDIIAQNVQDAPISNYLYASRRSLIPIMIKEKVDLYDLDSIISIYQQTPKKIINLLKDILSDEIQLNLEQKCYINGIVPEKNFENKYEFNKFIEVLINNYYDKNKIEKYKKMAFLYFDNIITEKDCIFDIGYSGKLPVSISNLIDKKIDIYYIHTNTDQALKLSRKYNFKLKTFYDYTPAISSTIREYLFAEMGSACIGYKENNDRIIPIFEEDPKSYIEKYIMNIIQDAAKDFARDIINIFGEYIDLLYYRNQDISLPYELFLHASKEFDRRIFKVAWFEDIVHAGFEKKSLYSIWNWNIQQNKLQNINGCEKTIAINTMSFLDNSNKYKKAIYYFLFDRNVFKDKIKQKFSKRPLLLFLAKYSYKGLRKIKRIILK